MQIKKTATVFSNYTRFTHWDTFTFHTLNHFVEPKSKCSAHDTKEYRSNTTILKALKGGFLKRNQRKGNNRSMKWVSRSFFMRRNDSNKYLFIVRHKGAKV